MTQSLDEILEDEVLLKCRLNGRTAQNWLFPDCLCRISWTRPTTPHWNTHGMHDRSLRSMHRPNGRRGWKSCLVMAASAAGKTIQTIEDCPTRGQPQYDLASIS